VTGAAVATTISRAVGALRRMPSSTREPRAGRAPPPGARLASWRTSRLAPRRRSEPDRNGGLDRAGRILAATAARRWRGARSRCGSSSSRCCRRGA
jgi:hypothetical protein